MGGHGGLNILPQKRWNVYGRENRLKVSQDEAKYEAEEQEKRDKHEAAEREYRHKLMLERARQKYGGRANVLITEDGRAEVPTLPSSLEDPNIDEEGIGATVTAVEHIADEEALESFEKLQDRQAAQRDPIADLEAQAMQHHLPLTKNSIRDRKHIISSRSSRKAKRSRQDEEEDAAAADDDEFEQGYNQQKVSVNKGPAPSLAYLAQQLHPGDNNNKDTQLASSSVVKKGKVVSFEQGGVERAEDRSMAVVNGGNQQQQPVLQHVNLFAAEEARAKNPETEKEKRDEKRQRGNADTQTSDPRFDAQFQFAHNLSGRAAVPWYARSDGVLGGPGAGGKEPLHHEAKLDEWRRHATAALAAAAADNGSKSLLQGIRVVEKAAEGEVKGSIGGGAKKKKQKKEKALKKSSKSFEGGGRGSRDSSTESDSGSGSSSEDDGKHKRNKKSSKDSKKKDKSKRKKKDGGRKGESFEKDRKASDKALMLMKLREERLEREREERKREQAVLRGGGAAPAGRRYHSGFGFGH